MFWLADIQTCMFVNVIIETLQFSIFVQIILRQQVLLK